MEAEMSGPGMQKLSYSLLVLLVFYVAFSGAV